MNKRIIDNMAAAAEYINKVIEAGRLGDFGGPNCRSWYDGAMFDYLDVINRLEWLKNEYTCNCLEAASAANPESAAQAIKSYYRAKIDKCKELCPYEDCGLYCGKLAEPTPWPVSKEWLCRDFDNDAIKESKCALAWPIMRALEKGQIDADTASELLAKAYQFQSSYARGIAAIIEWWSEICPPHNALENLERYQKANTPSAQWYFNKAISKGYMRETNTGYEWLLPEGRGRQSALAYFLGRVYTDEMPEKDIKELFGMKRARHYADVSRTKYSREISALFE